MAESRIPLDQVIHGDCLDVLKALPDKCVDLVFADPPYNLQLRQELWRPNMTKVDAVDDEWDRFDGFAEYDRFTRNWLDACRRVLKDTGTLWVIGTYHNIYRVGAALQDLGYWVLNDVSWIKCLAGTTELFGLMDGIPIVSTLKDLARISPMEHQIELPAHDKGGCFRWVKVTHWQKRQKAVGVRIDLDDGTWVECSPEHRFPVAREGKVEFVRAEELSREDTLLQLGRFHLPCLVESTGIDQPFGEVIGWYLAEGSCLSEGKGIVLSLSGDETDAARQMIETIRERFGVMGRTHRYGSTLHLVFPGRFMQELIQRFVRGENAKTKRLAREAFLHGAQFLQGILTGYLKGDGHWDAKARRWRLGMTKNLGMINDLGVVCRILGYRMRFNGGFVPYKDSSVEVIRGEIRENLANRWDYADLPTLGLPSRGFFSGGQSHSISRIRVTYRLTTRKSPSGTMTELGQWVIHGDVRLVHIKQISRSTQRLFYDVAVEGEHVFSLANGLLTHNSNPMPNFRGVRFTNAHETLIWAQKKRGARYTFNHHAMKALNDDVQMRSDWYLPLCTGNERIKVNGAKAHTTQKPEGLLYRVILASSNPGDVVLDPFFGTGTTGAVAKKLHRHWIGIERDEAYVRMAQQRIDAIQVLPFSDEVFTFASRRNQPRIPFGALLERGLLQPGQKLYFGKKGDIVATVMANGHIRYNGLAGSIHQVGRAIQNAPCNGWEHWYYEDPASVQRVVINELRRAIREEVEQK